VVYNALLRATTVTSKFGRAEAIPTERLRAHRFVRSIRVRRFTLSKGLASTEL